MSGDNTRQRRKKAILKDLSNLMSGDNTGKAEEKFQDVISRKKTPQTKEQSQFKNVVDLKQKRREVPEKSRDKGRER